MDAVIQPLPPNDGRDWDCQCARCGSSAEADVCEYCCGDGIITTDETEWDETEEYRQCPECLGNAVRYRCLSSAEWCDANPLDGREHIQRGAIEWFCAEKGGAA